MSPQQQKNHPYGTTLLSRDKPENRELWGPDGVGYADVASTVCTNDHKCPYHHYKQEQEDAKETPIHLLIASFRDQLCPRTIHNVFQHAEHPQRIYIRVIEQTKADSNLIDDAGCWDRYCTDYNKNCQDEYKSQVRIVHVNAEHAKGPTDANSKLSAMILWDYTHPNQPDLTPVEIHDFCMQTDSHMDFADHWDSDMIQMFHRTSNDYAVLSTYVADISQNNQDVRTVPNLCMVTFTSTIRNWGTKECRNLVVPKLTNAMWGAGLSFHRCHAELNVPVDPYLDNVFDGEEGSRGIRFFTHGYDVYTPDRVLVTHDYKTHQSNPVVHSWGGGLRGGAGSNNQQQHEEHWVFTDEIEEARSNLTTFGTKRVNALLGIGPDSSTNIDPEELERIRYGRFGLGTKRSLEQAAEFTGIDLRNRKMVKNRCGNLIWVPFDEENNGSNNDYGVTETLSRGLAGGRVDPPIHNTRITSRRRRKARIVANAASKARDAVGGVLGPGGVIVGSLLLLIAAAVLVTLNKSRRKRKNVRHLM